MTTPEEVQALRDTIVTLRQRIADLESAQTLSAADRVILRAMEGGETTLAQLAAETGMSCQYIGYRLSRIAGMCMVERCGALGRPKGSGGRYPVLWRIRA